MDTIKFAKVKENAIIPSKNAENAGYDIYGIFGDENDDNRILSPHTTKLIPTGIACALPQKYYFQVEERGSTGSKGIKKSAGVIDSGYRGEIFIAITNSTDKFLIFGDKDSYIKNAKKELDKWKAIDEKNLTEKDIQALKNVLINISNFSLFSSLASNCGVNLQESIYYSDKKAIAQLILHEVPVVNIEEVSFEDLQKVPSERKDGKLGSSGK